MSGRVHRQANKSAIKDSRKLKEAGLDGKAKKLIEVLSENPFQSPPPYEKLLGKLAPTYSRRINNQHRIVYEVCVKERVVKIVRMWTHYE